MNAARSWAIVIACASMLAACTSSGDQAPSGNRTGSAEQVGQQYAAVVVGAGLNAPWDMAFLPDGSALLTERPGRVRLVTPDGRLVAVPVAEIAVAQTFPPEQRGRALTAGLLGVAADPRFADNQFVYFYRTTATDNQVVRYRYRDGRLSDDTVVLGGIPPSQDHVGGRLRFGPDGWLYVTTGYLTDQSWPQDQQSLAGKVLRVSPQAAHGSTGGRPETYASGFRNPQGIDWLPDSRMVVTDHGASANDELNVVTRGGNYGWPSVEGDRTAAGLRPPLVLWPTSIAPSGVTTVRRPGSRWTGSLLVAALRGQQLRRVVLDGDRLVTDEPLLTGVFGRIRLVAEAPDGRLYLLISNRHLGTPGADDDRLVRLEPPR